MGNRLVAFSGGIDSTALALIEADALLVFTDTGWEFPHVYEHIAKFEQVTGREVTRLVNKRGETLPEYIKRLRFMPNHGARFCTREFKIEPFETLAKQQEGAVLLIGLRADEPHRAGYNSEVSGLPVEYPLRDAGMTRLDCVQLCAEYGLLPRYPIYAARGGCVGCFYKRRSEVQAMIALVPDMVDQLQTLEEEVQAERGKYFHMFPNCGMSIAEMRAQQMLFTPEQVYGEAMLDYDTGMACGLFCNR